MIINTDAQQILEKYPDVGSKRVEIRDRKSEICGDFVSMNRVIEDDVHNIPGDIRLMTHATNPLLSGKTIRSALKTFQEGVKTEPRIPFLPSTGGRQDFIEQTEAPLIMIPINWNGLRIWSLGLKKTRTCISLQGPASGRPGRGSVDGPSFSRHPGWSRWILMTRRVGI